MEGQGYNLIYDSACDTIERETSPPHRNYYDGDADDDKSKSNKVDIRHYGNASSKIKTKSTPERMSLSGSGVRSRRKENYSNVTREKYTFRPSLTEKRRQSPSSSSSSRKPPVEDSHKRESSNVCIQNNFDLATLPSAKSIAYSLANPCGLTTTNAVDSNVGQLLPMTPSTVESSSSDESQTSRGESFETSPSLCSPRDRRSSIYQRRSNKLKSENGRNDNLLTGRLESRRSFAFAHSANVDTEDGDMIIFVGNEQYRFSSSGSSMSFASKFFLSQRKQAEHFSYVDLSSHSYEEFKVVMHFFENNSAKDAWSNIHWKNLPVILPWFVEFKALPLINAVDTFLLHNGLSASGDREHRGDNSNKYRCVSLSNLLSLTQIAFACGLESTRSHARRLLRQGLLEPRKQTDNPELDSNRLAELAVDIELEWTLEDLRVLAQILQTHDDLREYLWEVAVIIYLPHDLDISNSVGLVSNDLFPYLLREGMMQMMIVEGIESSYQTNGNSLHTASSVTSVSIISNNKAVGSSFSEHTTCSDTTIPTTPSIQRNSLTEKEMQWCFQSIIKQLEKFKAEKETRATMLEEQQNNSLIVDEVNVIHKARPRRGYEGSTNRGATPMSTSRGTTTFAC